MSWQQKRPHPHPAYHSGVECSRTIFCFSGVSLRGMPAQKTPSFASPAHARFAKVFSFAGCSRLLVLSYTARDAKGVIRWRGADFSAWPPGPFTGVILPNLALSMQMEMHQIIGSWNDTTCFIDDFIGNIGQILAVCRNGVFFFQ